MRCLLFLGFSLLATSLRMPFRSDVKTSSSASLIQPGERTSVAFQGLDYDAFTPAEAMQDLQHWEAKNVKPKSQGGNKRVAIFISGLQDHLVLTSKLNVIESLNEQGYSVDVFVHLVASNQENEKTFSHRNMKNPTQGNYRNNTNLCELLETKIKDVANLAYCKLVETKEDVSNHVNMAAKLNLKRFKQYPLTTDAGQNVLRRFLNLEHLMKTSAERDEYQYYLVTRDDDYWFAPLNISALPNKIPKNVYFKNCLGFGGLNDKTFLFGHEAGKKILSNVFTDFLMEDQRLETQNAEQYWNNYISMKDVVQKPVDFDLLPTADGAHQWKDGSSVLCIRDGYLCKHEAISPETPQICEMTKQRH